MSAPRMKPSDWRNDKSPAETNPISISVVADEDWMTAVTSAPEPDGGETGPGHAREQVAKLRAGGALQSFADQLHAVEQQCEAAEQGRQQRHRASDPLGAHETAPRSCVPVERRSR